MAEEIELTSEQEEALDAAWDKLSEDYEGEQPPPAPAKSNKPVNRLPVGGRKSHRHRPANP